jgi:hypothetical protein
MFSWAPRAIWICALACMAEPAPAQFQLHADPPGVFALGANDLIGYTAHAHSLYLNYEAQTRLLRAKKALCGARFVVELPANQSYRGRFLCDDSKAPPSGAFIDLSEFQGARLDIHWGGKDPDRRASAAFEDWLAEQQLLYRRHRVVARCLSIEPTHWRRAAIRFNFALERASELGPELELVLYFDGAPTASTVMAALGIQGHGAGCTGQTVELTLDIQQAPSRFIHLVAVAASGR